MSGCPSVQIRNRGSGYVKQSTGGGAKTELDTKLADLLAARDAMDAKLKMPVVHTEKTDNRGPK
jgi:hypothetical protein